MKHVKVILFAVLAALCGDVGAGVETNMLSSGVSEVVTWREDVILGEPLEWNVALTNTATQSIPFVLNVFPRGQLYSGATTSVGAALAVTNQLNAGGVTNLLVRVGPSEYGRLLGTTGCFSALVVLETGATDLKISECEASISPLFSCVANQSSPSGCSVCVSLTLTNVCPVALSGVKARIVGDELLTLLSGAVAEAEFPIVPIGGCVTLSTNYIAAAGGVGALTGVVFGDNLSALSCDLDVCVCTNGASVSEPGL